MNGYDEAYKIDTMLNNLLETNPISQDNVFEWEKLVRTVKTTLKIIDNQTLPLIEKMRATRSEVKPNVQ